MWASIIALCFFFPAHARWLLVPCSVVPVVLVLFTFYFFRDPERTPPADPALAVSPADGVVTEISETTNERGEAVKRVGIFLSVFNVHINRSPIAGVVEASEEKVGKYYDARNPLSSTMNARRTWVIRGVNQLSQNSQNSQSSQCSITVRQITGAIARRIVAWSKVGDTLERGERFGLIRFGSRTEVDFPASVEILVKKGDVVRGGETPVARGDCLIALLPYCLIDAGARNDEPSKNPSTLSFPSDPCSELPVSDVSSGVLRPAPANKTIRHSDNKTILPQPSINP